MSAYSIKRHFHHGLILFILVSSMPALACDRTITTQMIESSDDMLVLSMLKLALSKTDKVFCYKHLTEVITDARKTRRVEKGLLSVKWESASSSERGHLKPVPVPIFRGLMGHRVFVIRDGEQARFSAIRSLADLKQLKAGQGLFWADTKILRGAGLPVVTSAQARNLWTMLKSSRFDYIPLGIHEPWVEVESRASFKMAVEPNLLLSYPSGLFFYVNPKDTELYELILRGMQRAIEDESYDRALFHSDFLQKTLQYANADQRHMIEIDNRLIGEDILGAIRQYGIAPSELKGHFSKFKAVPSSDH